MLPGVVDIHILIRCDAKASAHGSAVKQLYHINHNSGDKKHSLHEAGVQRFELVKKILVS